jgi:hypothetical protein
MSKTLIGVVAVIYTVAVMSIVVRRHGRGAGWGERTSMSEVFWVATLWGVTCGAAMYINPTTHFYSPPISIGHKLLFWALALLAGLTLVRTFLTIQPVSRKILTALLGLAFYFIIAFALGLGTVADQESPGGEQAENVVGVMISEMAGHRSRLRS